MNPLTNSLHEMLSALRRTPMEQATASYDAIREAEEQSARMRANIEAGYVICPLCATSIRVGEMCPHHVANAVLGYDDWSRGNRIMCDFFHRRRVPPRLKDEEREDFWGDMA